MAGSPTSIVCPSCGKRYAYKPELAGKRVKCKCGGVISVPAPPPAAVADSAEAAPPGFDDVDFGAPAADAPATPMPLSPRPATALRSATHPAPAAAPVSDAPAKKKDDWRWWQYVGAGVLVAALTVFEFYRLGQLESGEVESLRVGRWEAFMYNLVGRMGVLIIGMLVAAGW